MAAAVRINVPINSDARCRLAATSHTSATARPDRPGCDIRRAEQGHRPCCRCRAALGCPAKASAASRVPWSGWSRPPPSARRESSASRARRGDVRRDGNPQAGRVRGHVRGQHARPRESTHHGIQAWRVEQWRDRWEVLGIFPGNRGMSWSGGRRQGSGSDTTAGLDARRMPCSARYLR
jgi:hypothetical protein